METLERSNPQESPDKIGVIDKISFNFPEKQETFQQYVELFEKSLSAAVPREAIQDEKANALVSYTYGKPLELGLQEVSNRP